MSKPAFAINNNVTTKTLLMRYQQIRQTSVKLCEPLATEDMVVQPVNFVSPPKWHLAHTTWFFVNFIFHRYDVDYSWPKPYFPILFNSYYKSQSEHWQQAERGTLSRPTVKEVLAFRQEVDDIMLNWLSSFTKELPSDLTFLIELGLQHEQQHQELLLMDIKYILWHNPEQPAYFLNVTKTNIPSPQTHTKNQFNSYWHSDGGLLEFGLNFKDTAFCFDNETPKHQSFLAPYKIDTNLISNADYNEFIRDGGYENPLLWLSEGWDFIQGQAISAPLYWHGSDQDRHIYTLSGLSDLNPNAPVSHLSFHEAYAYARWAQKRLPNEYEWEHFASQYKLTHDNTFLEQTLSEQQEPSNDTTNNIHGGLWEWTSSAYSAYPGYDASRDALGEYNGKFMINQIVLRGGCLATPQSHYRSQYRNFYLATQRWFFSGLRLAK